MGQQHRVPPAGGLAVVVSEGATIRVSTPHGAQAADFWAYDAASPRDWLSPMHTWVTTRSVKPRVGDALRTRFRRPLLELVDDGADGCHDMLIASCDQARYEHFGHVGPHANCADNLRAAMARLGHAVDVVPQPVNFFTNSVVDAEHRLLSPPNPVPAGAYVVLRALRDAICVVSSCPFDLAVPGWTINAPGGPTEILLDVDGPV